MPQRILEGSADTLHLINRWSMRAFGLVARVRPDERRDALGAFLTLFGFMVGHGLLETARDALFLATLPARRLPWVYLAIAVLTLAIGQREPHVVRRITARNELSRWLLMAGIVTCGIWLLVERDRVWLLYGLYVWSGVLASLVVVRFWTVLGGRFTLTQAKRIFAVIGTGSVTGAIVGSAAARLLTGFVGPQHLVLAAGIVFLLSSAAPAMLGSDEPGRRVPADGPALLRQVLGNPYLRQVMALVLLATVTFTLVDYVFKSAADRLVATQSLGEFFSTVYLSINVASLLVQALVVGWLLRRMGVASAMLVVPSVLLVSTLGFAVGGGLALALVLKGSDGSLRHSLHRTLTELLFVPLSNRVRDVKGMIDVLGQRGGQAVASIAILMVLSTTGRESVFAALACLTAAGWLAVAVGMREHYLDLFRQTLLEDNALPEDGFPALDHASVETLLATLNATDERRVLAALDILRMQGDIGLVPLSLLFHPSSAVVTRTLEHFVASGRGDAVAMVERVAGHPDPDVRAAAVRALGVLAPSREVLEGALADPDGRVRVTAEVLLVACGWSESVPLAEEHLLEIADGAVRAEQQALAMAVRARPHPGLEGIAATLLRSDDPDVLREAIAAVRALGSPELIDPLLPLLERRAVREDVRATLASFGPIALTRLAGALADRDLPHAVRRNVPGALALIGSPQAAELLLGHLAREPDGMIRFKVLRALGRWRTGQPHLPLNVDLLRDALAYALSTGFRLMGWRHALAGAAERDGSLATELHDVLFALLADKQDHALERVFRLLNLQAGTEEFQRIYLGLHSPVARSRAGSRELLQHMVVPTIRRPLLTLVDDLHGEGGGVSEEPWSEQVVGRDDYARVLAELVGCGMESLSSLAAAHAAELRLTQVGRSLARCTPLSDEHRDTLDRSARTLREALTA